jgi:hypothetical protein
VTQAELLRHLVDALVAAGAEYMIGGSHASVYYGEPRLTRDVDVIVGLRSEHLPLLLARFPADEYYFDAQTAEDAIRTAGQFNIIHPRSGLKIDVYVNPDTAYDRTRFSRRQKLPFAHGGEAYFARAEDVILYKLLYHRHGGSGLHRRDVLGIMRVSGHELDERYLADWAERLGLAESWEEVRRQAESERDQGVP